MPAFSTVLLNGLDFLLPFLIFTGIVALVALGGFLFVVLNYRTASAKKRKAMIWITVVTALLLNLMPNSLGGLFSIPLLLVAVMAGLLAEGAIRNIRLGAESSPAEVHRLANWLGVQGAALIVGLGYLARLVPMGALGNFRILHQVWFFLVPLLTLYILIRKLDSKLGPVAADLEVTFHDRLLLGLRIAVVAAIVGTLAGGIGIGSFDHVLNMVMGIVGILTQAVVLSVAAVVVTFALHYRPGNKPEPH